MPSSNSARPSRCSSPRPRASSKTPPCLTAPGKRPLPGRPARAPGPSSPASALHTRQSVFSRTARRARRKKRSLSRPGSGPSTSSPGRRSLASWINAATGRGLRTRRRSTRTPSRWARSAGARSAAATSGGSSRWSCPRHTDIGSGGSSTRFATMSGCPASTAEPTASSHAAGWNGTLKNVTSSTGRSPAPGPARARRGLRARAVLMSLRIQLPGRKTARPPPDKPPPARHVQQEPARHDDRHQQQQPLRDQEREQGEGDAESEGRADGHQPVPAHLAHDSPVLGGRDLIRVPLATAAFAGPALTVSQEPNRLAVACHGHASTLHRPSVRRADPNPQPGGAYADISPEMAVRVYAQETMFHYMGIVVWAARSAVRVAGGPFPPRG